MATFTAVVVLLCAKNLWTTRSLELWTGAKPTTVNVLGVTWFLYGMVGAGYLFFSEAAERNYAWLAVLVLSIWSIAASGSRAALGMAIVGVGMIVLLCRSWRILLFGLVALIAVCLLSPRMLANLGKNTGSYHYRFKSWQVSYAVWKKAPWIGHGPKSFARVFTAENGGGLYGFKVANGSNFLATTLVEAGLLGALVLVLFWFVMIKTLAGSEDPLQRALLCAFIGYLAGGMVLDHRFLTQGSGLTIAYLVAIIPRDAEGYAAEPEVDAAVEADAEPIGLIDHPGGETA